MGSLFSSSASALTVSDPHPGFLLMSDLFLVTASAAAVPKVGNSAALALEGAAAAEELCPSNSRFPAATSKGAGSGAGRS